MLTSCPRVIDCTCDQLLGGPKHHGRTYLNQELVLSREQPVIFREEVKEDAAMLSQQHSQKQQAQTPLVPIKTLNNLSGEDWYIKARVTKKGKKVSY